MTLDLQEAARRVRLNFGWEPVVEQHWRCGRSMAEIVAYIQEHSQFYAQRPNVARDSVIRWLKKRPCVASGFHVWHARCWDCDEEMNRRFRVAR